MVLQLADALLPSCAVQVMIAVPFALPVTTPALDTVAALELLDFQVTFLFVAEEGLMAAVSLYAFCAFSERLALFSLMGDTSCFTVTVLEKLTVLPFFIPTAMGATSIYYHYI